MHTVNYVAVGCKLEVIFKPTYIIFIYHYKYTWQSPSYKVPSNICKAILSLIIVFQEAWYKLNKCGNAKSPVIDDSTPIGSKTNGLKFFK